MAGTQDSCSLEITCVWYRVVPELNASDAESRQQTESDENSALALLTTVCPKPPGVPRGKLDHGSETMSGTLTNFSGSAEDDWLNPAVHANQATAAPRQDCLKAPSAGHGLPKELQWAGRQTWSRSCEAAEQDKNRNAQGTNTGSCDSSCMQSGQ